MSKRDRLTYWKQTFHSHPSRATAAAYREAAEWAWQHGAPRQVVIDAYLETTQRATHAQSH